MILEEETHSPTHIRLKVISFFLIILFFNSPSFACIHLNKVKGDTLYYDSFILVIKGKQTECIHNGGFKVNFKSGGRFKRVVFIDSRNDTLTLNTGPTYPSLEFKDLKKSFLKEAAKNFRKGTVIETIVTSKYGEFFVKTYFTNDRLKRVEVENMGVKYILVFSSFGRYSLFELYGKQTEKTVTNFHFYKKKVSSLSIYHREKPESISAKYRSNGKPRGVVKKEYNKEGLIIKIYQIM